jgi:hypothetical protein
MEVRGQLHASTAVLPVKEPLVPIEEESGWFERFGDTWGIKPRTVTKHYTDYAIPAVRVRR